jgi:hypothetical protein
MSKFQLWYDGLHPNTREYLKNQPIWHDSDMWKASLFGAFIGFIIGVLVAWR